MKANVIIDITKEPDSVAITKTASAIEGLTDNSNFVNPIIPLDKMADDNKDLIHKLSISIRGNEADTLAKNLARDLVNSNYRAQGNYVNGICKGDKVKAESSKFDLRKPRTKYNKPALEARNRKAAGAITVYSRAKPKGLLIRLIQYSLTPQEEGSWKWGGLTRKQKKHINNLTIGLKYWIRVAVVVNEEIVDWCEPFYIIVT